MAENRGPEDWHVTAALLRALELKEIDLGVCLILLVEHLATFCPTCREGLGGFLDDASCHSTDETDDGVISDDFIDRAAARALEYGRLEEAAVRQLATLRAVPAHPQRLALVASGSALANPALVELLLDEARGCIHDSPSEAGELAEIAEAVAHQLALGPYGGGFCRDRVTEALAHRANSLRAQGELERAKDLLAQVERRARDSCDLFLRAEVAGFQAALAKDLRRFQEALGRLDEAERLYLEVDAAVDLVAQIRLQRASVLSQLLLPPGDRVPMPIA